MNAMIQAQNLAVSTEVVRTTAFASKRNSQRLGARVWFMPSAKSTLAPGVLGHAPDCPVATVGLLPQVVPFAHVPHIWRGAFDNRLPEFVHVYTVIFATVAVRLRSMRVHPICVLWWAVASLIAVPRHPAIAPHSAKAFPAWFQHLLILDNTATSIRRGTANSPVLLAIAPATLSAFFTGDIPVKEAGHVLDA